MQELARAEARQPGIDGEVVVVAEGVAGEEWDEGVRVHRVPGWGTVASNPLSPALHRFLVGSARSGAHDVWHFHYPFLSGELSLVCSSMRLVGRPAAVCTYHSDIVATSAAKRALSIPYAALTLTDGRALRQPARRNWASGCARGFGGAGCGPRLVGGERTFARRTREAGSGSAHEGVHARKDGRPGVLGVYEQLAGRR